jgi:hypothetical protein
MRGGRRRASPWRSALRARRRRLTSRLAALLKTAGGVVRLFGWLYVAVLVPALLIAGYLVIRDATAGADVSGSLYLVPLAMIWPVAAIALRGDSALALGFPLNALVLVGTVALVLLGWTVLFRAVRDLRRGPRWPPPMPPPRTGLRGRSPRSKEAS